MRKPTTFLLALVLGIAGAILAAAPALAFPIIYTEQATGTFCWGATTNTGLCPTADVLSGVVALSMSQDTANVTVTTSPTIYHNYGTATVTITMSGGNSVAATFTDPSLEVFSAPSPAPTPYSPAAVGFADVTRGVDILDDINDAFATYDLKSVILDISGTALFNANQYFDTTAGYFAVTSVTSSVTFSAVPAPSIDDGLSVLLVVGSVFLGATIWERAGRGRAPAA